MNVLGGYQKIDLSTADLTSSPLSVEGLSKACANANGKAVLAKMPDGTEVFGAVKGVTGGYQLSVLGADSKISRLNIDDADDTFTIDEGAGVDGGESEVALQNYTDLSSYSENTPFTVPNDGLLKLTTTGQITSESGFKIKTPAGFTIGINYLGSTTNGNNSAMFIRKGTIVAPYGDTTRATFRFYEYKPVEV